MSKSKFGVGVEGNMLARLMEQSVYGLGLTSNATPNLTSPEDILERALSYAVCVSAQWINDGDVYIPFLDEPLMVALAHFEPIHQYTGYDNKNAKLVGWKVPDISLDEWVRRFAGNAKAAALIRNRLALNLSNELPMTKAALQFAAMLAEGIADPPAPRKKKTKFHRDCLLASIAKKVSVAYKIPLGAAKTRYQDETAPICGSVISAAALHGHGVFVEFIRADTISRKSNLPIEKTVKYLSLSHEDQVKVRNYLAPVPPDEFRADALVRFSEQFRAASRKIGLNYPFSE